MKNEFGDAAIGADPESPEGLWWAVRPAFESFNLWRLGSGPLRRLGGVRPRRSSFPTVTRVSGGLTLTHAPNEVHALRPVIDALGAAEVVPNVLTNGDLVSATAALTSARVRAVESWGRERLAQLGRAELAPAWRARLLQTLVAERAVRRIGLDHAAFLVVSIQSAPTARVAVRAAHQAGVPTVFVPHAPFTRLVQLLDLPVDLAIMRGPAESEYLAAHGITGDGIRIAGNPSVDLLSDTQLPPLDGPRVLALSPDPPSVLREIIRIVADSGVGPHVIAPHPSSDLDELERMLPPGWTLNRGERTVELLKRGATYLIQYSSGVALESTMLGIPTAEMRLGDRLPDYAFLDDTALFPTIGTPADVRTFAGSAVDREWLRRHARRWVSQDGPDSAQETAALIKGTVSPSGVVHDGWAAHGVARTSSTFV